jgi:hypothetical protein
VSNGVFTGWVGVLSGGHRGILIDVL